MFLESGCQHQVRIGRFERGKVAQLSDFPHPRGSLPAVARLSVTLARRAGSSRHSRRAATSARTRSPTSRRRTKRRHPAPRWRAWPRAAARGGPARRCARGAGRPCFRGVFVREPCLCVNLAVRRGRRSLRRCGARATTSRARSTASSATSRAALARHPACLRATCPACARPSGTCGAPLNAVQPAVRACGER